MAARAHSSVDKQAYSSTMWMLALLTLSSSLLAAPAAAQLGAYSSSEPGAYSFNDPGAYNLAGQAEPGAYTFAGRGMPGTYSFAEAIQPGGYYFAEPGGYSLGADIPSITVDDLADSPKQKLPGQHRRLLAVSEITVPASIPPSTSGSTDNVDLDIVPAELPASSWDAKNWPSWQDWHSQHVNTHPDVGGAGTYGMGVAGDYGQGSYGYGGYGGSYGSAGAYFDFRSNRAFVPEQAVNTAQPDSTVLPAGLIVRLPSSTGARWVGNYLGSGFYLGSLIREAAAASPSFTGRASLAALNLQQPERLPFGARRLLAQAAAVLSGPKAKPIRLSKAATAPGYFARRLHMARSG
ncbi:hypothetical protein COO60DRAFT_1482746 [Scenedesmus sp. NREL 46B-D3]|nr:hypothetical protein COO60DRAFT_1482746 [Scenedesmus sp. NREL 46B-D3]